MLMIKVQNIKEGDTYKSYKHLCEVLEEKVKAGNSKKAQIADWERYFEYTKKGNKFVIERIFETPLPEKVNKRNSLGHSERMDQILLYLLDKQEEGTLFLSINSLLKELNMTNVNYGFAKANKRKTSNFLNVKYEIVEDFFNTSHRTLRDNVESMLKRLANRALIDHSKVKTVCVANVRIDKDTFGRPKANSHTIVDDFDNEDVQLSASTYVYREYREATKEEVELILKAEGDFLDELGYENKRDVVLNGEWHVYRNKINNFLFDEANILFYYDSYRIIRNRERISNEASKIEEDFLTEEELNYLNNRKILNSSVELQLHTNLHKRQEKAELEGLFGYDTKRINLRSSDSYIPTNEKIIKALINEDSPDIRGDIRETAINKNNDDEKVEQ